MRPRSVSHQAAIQHQHQQRANRWGLFDGAGIARMLPKGENPSHFARRELERGALVLPVAKGNRVLMAREEIQWLTKPQIEETFQLRYEDDTASFTAAEDDASSPKFDLIFLGRDEGREASFFALDLTTHGDLDPRGGGPDEDPSFGELRAYIKAHGDLLGSGDRATAVSRAGYALALGNWARGVRFCPSCGSPTRSTAIGTRKQCTNIACGKKQYPRVDPVAIMLVVSRDGNHVLLASPKYASGRMLTCLAGFIEQCETIEEAVAREVQEECGVDVEAVEILGSQPWPLGRSGACELMIGCLARAATNPSSAELKVDTDELNSATWVPVSVAAEKLARSKERGRRPTEVAADREDTFIVPSYAIAHQIITHFMETSGHAPSVPKL